MVVTTDFYLQVVYICSLKVTHGGNYRLLPTSGVHMFSQGHSWWQNSGLLYIWKKSLKVTHGGKTPDLYIYIFLPSRSLMVAKLPTFIDIHLFSQGHSWWQNSRLLYMVKNNSLKVTHGGKTPDSQGHSWWQKAPNFYIWYIYIYICSLKTGIQPMKKNI